MASNFQSWLDHKLKIGVYELRSDTIVCGKGRRSEHTLAIAELVSWQVFPEMGFDLVVIESVGGQQLRWIDKYDDLIAILRKVAPEKERDRPTG